MTPATKFSYQRLRNETNEDEIDYDEEMQRAIDHVKSRIRSSSRLKRVHMRKRLKMKIPGFKNFMSRRARVIRVSIAKIVKRLKESQSHFGDLFAGNYLLMQVNPSSLKHVKMIEDNLGRNSPQRIL